MIVKTSENRTINDKREVINDDLINCEKKVTKKK